MLWNHEGTGDNPQYPSYFVRLVNEFEGYQGQVKSIEIWTSPFGSLTSSTTA
jgi:hypothetical protein